MRRNHLEVIFRTPLDVWIAWEDGPFRTFTVQRHFNVVSVAAPSVFGAMMRLACLALWMVCNLSLLILQQCNVLFCLQAAHLVPEAFPVNVSVSERSWTVQGRFGRQRTEETGYYATAAYDVGNGTCDITSAVAFTVDQAFATAAAMAHTPVALAVTSGGDCVSVQPVTAEVIVALVAFSLGCLFLLSAIHLCVYRACDPHGYEEAGLGHCNSYGD
jgi:hypothetical protein